MKTITHSALSLVNAKPHVLDLGPLDADKDKIIRWEGRAIALEAAIPLILREAMFGTLCLAALGPDEIYLVPNDRIQTKEWAPDGKLTKLVVSLEGNKTISYELVDGEFRTFTTDGEGGKVEQPQAIKRGKAWDRLPFAWISASDNSAQETSAFLGGAAAATKSLIQLNALMARSAHWASMPTLAITGVTQDTELPEAIGPSTVIAISNENAKVQFLSWSPGAAQALLEVIKQQEKNLAGAGLQLFTGGNLYASGAALDVYISEARSPLQIFVQAAGHGIQQVLGLIADWRGKDAAKIKIRLNDDLSMLPANPEVVRQLKEAVQAGLISQDSFLDYLRKVDLLSSTTNDEERMLVSNSPFAMPPLLQGGA